MSEQAAGARGPRFVAARSWELRRRGAAFSRQPRASPARGSRRLASSRPAQCGPHAHFDIRRALQYSLQCTPQSSDEQSAQEVLEQLIEVAEQHPKFLKKQLPEVIAAMLQIANAPQLDPPTRTLAVEFMVTLCEARDRAPGMVRRRARGPWAGPGRWSGAEGGAEWAVAGVEGLECCGRTGAAAAAAAW